MNRERLSALGELILILALIASMLSFTFGLVDAAFDSKRNCFQSKAPIKMYNPPYLAGCWLNTEQR